MKAIATMLSLATLTAVMKAAPFPSQRLPRSTNEHGRHRCSHHQAHTLDMYPEPGAALSCGIVTRRGVSDSEREEIVSGHNAIRHSVQTGQYADRNLPAGCELTELSWDGELAETAQRWADQCVLGHDLCRDLPRFAVGQNYAYVWSGEQQNWTTEALHQWFLDELARFRQEGLEYGGGLDPISGGYTGHLTQLLWADTGRVGCGFIAVSDALYQEQRTYICNYGPAGNLDSELIYQART